MWVFLKLAFNYDIILNTRTCNNNGPVSLYHSLQLSSKSVLPTVSQRWCEAHQRTRQNQACHATYVGPWGGLLCATQIWSQNAPRVSVRNVLTTTAGTIHISAEQAWCFILSARWYGLSLQPWLKGYACWRQDRGQVDVSVVSYSALNILAFHALCHNYTLQNCSLPRQYFQQFIFSLLTVAFKNSFSVPCLCIWKDHLYIHVHYIHTCIRT